MNAIVPLSSVVASLLAAAALTAPPASGADVNWPRGPYSYIALDQDLRDALVESGRNTGLPVKRSASTKGLLHTVMPASPADDFLRRRCASSRLVYYFDGYVAHTSAVGEIKTDVLPRGGKMTVDEAMARVRKLGIE